MDATAKTMAMMKDVKVRRPTMDHRAASRERRDDAIAIVVVVVVLRLSFL